MDEDIDLEKLLNRFFSDFCFFFLGVCQGRAFLGAFAKWPHLNLTVTSWGYGMYILYLCNLSIPSVNEILMFLDMRCIFVWDRFVLLVYFVPSPFWGIADIFYPFGIFFVPLLSNMKKAIVEAGDGILDLMETIHSNWSVCFVLFKPTIFAQRNRSTYYPLPHIWPVHNRLNYNELVCRSSRIKVAVLSLTSAIKVLSLK